MPFPAAANASFLVHQIDEAAYAGPPLSIGAGCRVLNHQHVAHSILSGMMEGSAVRGCNRDHAPVTQQQNLLLQFM